MLAPPMAAASLLIAALVATTALGALIGWLLGSWTLGALGGAVAGIPAGVAMVYRAYGRPTP
jgi:F0F1-type ATP synthase assembly protein I